MDPSAADAEWRWRPHSPMHMSACEYFLADPPNDMRGIEANACLAKGTVYKWNVCRRRYLLTPPSSVVDNRRQHKIIRTKTRDNKIEEQNNNFIFKIYEKKKFLIKFWILHCLFLMSTVESLCVCVCMCCICLFTPPSRGLNRISVFFFSLPARLSIWSLPPIEKCQPAIKFKIELCIRDRLYYSIHISSLLLYTFIYIVCKIDCKTHKIYKMTTRQRSWQ